MPPLFLWTLFDFEFFEYRTKAIKSFKISAEESRRHVCHKNRHFTSFVMFYIDLICSELESNIIRGTLTAFAFFQLKKGTKLLKADLFDQNVSIRRLKKVSDLKLDWLHTFERRNY